MFQLPVCTSKRLGIPKHWTFILFIFIIHHLAQLWHIGKYLVITLKNKTFYFLHIFPPRIKISSFLDLHIR